MKNYFRIIFNFLPPIKMHSWGGLGSQLFALNAVLLLKEKYPIRKIILVHHTGGLTRRPLELRFDGINIEIVDDFKPNVKETSVSLRPKFAQWLQHSKHFAKRFLIFTSFLQSMNDNYSFGLTKPWVMQIRGHYTRLPIKQENMKMIRIALFANLEESRIPANISSFISVHIRLGDLVTKKNSSLISPDVLLPKIAEFAKLGRVLLFSDSSKEELESFLGNISIWEYADISQARGVIQWCSMSKIFIGTNSKISFWISVLRIIEEIEGSTLVPEVIADWLREVLPSEKFNQNKVMAFNSQ